MFCKKCGKELEENSNFCNNCGTAVKGDNIERKTIYDGNIHKCPNCGEILDSFIANCPTCGYELRETKSTNALSEFVSKLEEIESKRENVKDSAIKNLYFGKTLTKTDEQKISLIRSFSIPNTKEDLYEFLVLSKSNIQIDLYQNTQLNDARLEVSNAWKAKFEQAYHKAKFVFVNDNRMSEIQAMYDETNKSIENAKWQIWKTIGISFGMLIGMFIIIFLMMMLVTPNNEIDKRGEIEKVSSESSVELDKDDAEKENEVLIDGNDKPIQDSLDLKKENSLSFNKEQIIKELKITEYHLNEDGDRYAILIIDNPTKYNLAIYVSMKFYDSNGNLVGVDDDDERGVEKGTQTIMYFPINEEYDYIKYEISVSEEDYYDCIISKLSYKNERIKNKEIISVTNNSEINGEFIEGYVLFFKGNKIVSMESEYFTDDDSIIEPEQTITKEIECDIDYDFIQFYLTGLGE